MVCIDSPLCTVESLIGEFFSFFHFENSEDDVSAVDESDESDESTRILNLANTLFFGKPNASSQLFFSFGLALTGEDSEHDAVTASGV